MIALFSAGLIHAAESASGPAQIPFQLHRGHVMVPAQVTNSVPLLLLLDTGYSMTMLHPEHVTALGLPRTGRRITIVGIAGEEQTDVFEGPLFAFGEATWKPRRVAALPGSSPSRRRRDGILGSGFFRRFVVEIDSQSQQLRLHEPDVFAYAGGGEILPLRFSGDTPVVEASVRLPDQSETKARFEIDTGCDGSICIGRHFVEANRLEPTNNLPGGGRGNRYGVGGAARTHDSHLPQLRLGNVVIDRPEASLFLEGSPVDPPLAGHLGWDLLRRFKVIFDYKRARMILEKSPGKPGNSAVKEPDVSSP
ncbi:MAG TPA: retropepsin-like aspartic protease [Verrucomicrobiae bacterium]|nr:retropepsin-like aspartic protease [Verrucomicrobiae bacterium]